MEFLKKVNALVLGLAVLLAFGCGVDDPEPEKIKKNCTVIERVVHYTNNFGQQLTETNEAILNAKGEIEEVMYKTFLSNNLSNAIQTYKITHVYNSTGQLIRKNFFFLPDNKLINYYEYEYNSNSLTSKIIGYAILNSDTIQNSKDSLVYYPDNRIKRYYTNPAVYNDYSYPSSNQVIKKTIFFDAAKDQEVIQNLYEIELDSKRANEAAIYLFHIPRGTIDEFSSNIISIKATNNVLGTTNTITYSYQYNSDDYPISWTSTNSSNNQVSTGSYNYNCQ